MLFVDRNQDGVIDQADANPRPVSAIHDQLLSDEVVVGNRSSNRMTPNGSKALLDQARRDIWPVHVPAADDEALAEQSPTRS